MTARCERSWRRPLPWLVGSWCVAIALGTAALSRYQLTTGVAATAPARWPVGIALEPAAERPTLVMIVHPRCACSRASVAELAWVMTRLQGQVEATVVALLPEGVDASWGHTELVEYASTLDGVTVVHDPAGALADAFGARTSGQTYLFATDGTLLFEGGLTATRAHVGDNVGRRRIVALVEGGSVERATSAVFGCDLRDERSEAFVPASGR